MSNYLERLQARDDVMRQRERERRRARDGWTRIPGNKTHATSEEVAVLLGTPCYEEFRDAEGVNWMRRIS
jgi:hypothetical protein